MLETFALSNISDSPLLAYWWFPYLAMFFISFLASTLLPLGSEIFLAVFLNQGVNMFGIVLIATIGNTLGSITTYYLAYFGRFILIEKWMGVRFEKIERYSKNANRFAPIMAFFVFLPVVGDIFALALGFIRADKITTFAMIFVGKFSRYALIAFVLS